VSTYGEIPTLGEALRRFRAGALRPSDLLEQLLDRIEAHDGELGAYVAVDAKGARAAAREADAAWRRGDPGPLCGAPISIKDIFDVEGSVAGCGNPQLSAGRAAATRDAEAVSRLRRHGAVILGRTQLHELALGISGENPRLGTPKNPHDPTRLPGGSSSGSAVSVAAGLALASLGTDTGGSVRVPAALCGLAGLKPTFGWIGRGGLHPLSPSMDHVGLLGRDVTDVALLFHALREPSHHRPVAHHPLRVGLVEELFRAADREVRQALRAALSALAPEVVTVESVSLRGLDDAIEAYGAIVRHEAAVVHREALATRPEIFDPPVREMLQAGADLSSGDHARAIDERERFRAACAALLSRYDGLVTPTTRVCAPPRGATEVAVDGTLVLLREALIRCTCPFSMLGLPALSVPVSAASGLPVGLQVLGPPGCEGTVLGLGAAVGAAVGAANGDGVATV
jgi:Asp-tRNA(Asn)/Glu-tRNA(Gln) amidotransferase A subunit family amidase